MLCWLCKQKAEYRREKLEKARAEAQRKAGEYFETMAIIEEGVLYKVVKASELNGRKELEFISKR